ncbi:MAG TPA: vanomycin resistance protein VanB [Firmicutes bacterium]|nr:vanomycin resistance protein VanB [Bacillota bacterium]HHY97927.1 vanomycin resistance protein VanB [Bacillota bacterium]
MRRRDHFLLVASVTAIFLGASLGIGAYYFLGDHVMAGVSLAGFKVGGCDAGSLTGIVAELKKYLAHEPITLVYGGYRRAIHPEELGVSIDAGATVEDLLHAGRQGPLRDRVAMIVGAHGSGIDLPVRVSVDPQKLGEMLLRIANDINIEPRNASFEDETGAEIAERPGRRLKVDEFRNMILDALGRFPREDISLPVEIIRPATTLEELRSAGARIMISSYRSFFDPSNRDRSYNIRLTASRLNGIIVGPGEEFSFNEAVGPRGPEYGFREAFEIVSREFVPGFGGGVCQMSSTLYNAALLAGQHITERHCHSLPLNYVPLGRDATVHYGSLDLKFRNPLPWPVMIQAKVTGNQVIASIYGRRNLGYEVQVKTEEIERIEPSVVERLDPTLPEGKEIHEQDGQPGYKVKTIRVMLKDGKEIRREDISFDTYSPIASIVRVGSGPLSVKR